MLDNTCVDPTSNFNKALRVATLIDNIDIVFLLLKDSRVFSDRSVFTAFRVAVRHGSHRVVKNLIFKRLVDPSMDNNSAIIEAASGGHEKIVEILIADPRVDPSVNHNAIIRKLMSCYRNRHCNFVNILKIMVTDPRVDPSYNNNELIRTAINEDNRDFIKALLPNQHVWVQVFISTSLSCNGGLLLCS